MPDDTVIQELINGARQAMGAAYAPYSHFQVGCAVLTGCGKIYTGCNIENASYGATNCAERTAIFKAVSEGHTEIAAVAICGGPEGRIEGTCPPCGICRQVMSEFGQADMPVLLIHKDGYEEHTLGELLPESFSLND